MTEKSAKPQIRFTGFDDNWEQRKALELAEYSKGNGYSKGDLTEAGTPIILYGRLYTKYQFAIDEVDTFTTPKSGSIYSQGNEIIVPTSGETAEDIARASAVEKAGVLLGGDLNILRPFDCINPLFLALAISNGEPQKELAKKAQGKSVVHIHNSDIQEITISYPLRAEQDRIVAVFRHLDRLITLHQRKYDKLINVKKSCLEKMFPKNGSNVPEIRFKGFSGAWEQRKLGDVATFINGRAYSQPELLSDGKYKVLRVGNFYTNDSWYYSDLDLCEKYYADYGDLLYTWSATFGPHIWLGDRVIYHYHIWKVELSEQLEKQFAVRLLEQDKANILSCKNGSTMVHITKEGMEQKDIIIPSSKDEQKAIGAYFQHLDHLITLHQRELEKLKNLKKACLEKMFV